MLPSGQPSPSPSPSPSPPRAVAPPPGGAVAGAASPLTYQVYAGDAPLSMRAPSRVSFSELAPRAPALSLGARVCLVLAGVCVVVATAGLIILGTSEEPRAKTTSSASGHGEVAATGTVAATTPAPEPPPIVIEPPLQAEPPPLPAVTTPAPARKAKAPGSAPALRGVAIPPNPFDVAGGAAPKAPAKKK